MVHIGVGENASSDTHQSLDKNYEAGTHSIEQSSHDVRVRQFQWRLKRGTSTSFQCYRDQPIDEFERVNLGRQLQQTIVYVTAYRWQRLDDTAQPCSALGILERRTLGVYQDTCHFDHLQTTRSVLWMTRKKRVGELKDCRDETWRHPAFGLTHEVLDVRVGSSID